MSNTTERREVDERGSCSRCGGVHFGTGPTCVFSPEYKSPPPWPDPAPTSPRQPVSAEQLAGILKSRVHFQNNFLTTEEWLDIATVAAEAYRSASLPVQQAQHSAKLQELVSYAQKHFHWQDIPGRWVFDGELGTLLKLIVDLRGPLAVIPRIKDEGAAPSTPPASSPQQDREV